MSKENCCIEDGKVAMPNRKGKGKKSFQMFDWVAQRNPILDQVQDSEEVTEFFQKVPLIPYAGTDIQSGQSLLTFFINMRHLSSTQGSCINSQRDLCFSGRPKVVYRVDDEFDLEDTDNTETRIPDANIKKKFTEFRKNKIKISLPSLSDFAKALFEDYKISGNAYFRINIITSLGNSILHLEYIDQTHCYYYDDKGKFKNTKAIAIIPNIDELHKEDFDVVPVYPNFTEITKGVKSSVYHIKNGPYKWYGRPDSMSSFLSQYREFQNEDYLIKQADKGFTGQVLIEVESGDEDTENLNGTDNSFDSEASRLEANFTNEAEDPLTIMFMERPFNTKPAFVHQFKPNTNEKFFKETGDIAERKIIKSHSWSARLLGDSAVSKGFSDNVFIEELKTKLPLINSLQEVIENPLNKVINDFIVFTNETELFELGFKFPKPYASILAQTENKQ